MKSTEAEEFSGNKGSIEKNDSLFLLLSSPAKNDQMASTYELLTSARSLGTLFYMSNTMIYLANGGFQRLNSVAVEDETRKYYLCIQTFWRHRNPF